MSKYVIVGASASGIGAVEAIRELDPMGTLTVVSEEACPQYSRPMISEFASGIANFERMMCREDGFWEKKNVRALTGRTAVGIDLASRSVVLDGGDRVDYEKLLIATGGKPFIPKIEGADRDGVFAFTTLADAEKLKLQMENAEIALVIGAGLIGVSVTEALVKKGLKVTMVELKDNILSLILDSQASKIVESTIKKAGVTIVTGQTVKRILGKTEDKSVVGGAIFTNGEQIQCDMVIVAIGVVPRVDLVLGTDVKINRGIIVDRFMRTNVPNVYASGDVAEAYDFVFGENRLLPLWPLANLEGKVAGYNMAGKKVRYPGGTSMSALKYFGLPIVSVGIVSPQETDAYELLVTYDPKRNFYKKIVLHNNVIVGMILVNQIENAGILLHLMRNFVKVKKLKNELLSENFSLANLPRSLRKKLYPGEYK
jgi:NAD(P)H-nitrite reductase large subunit